MGHFWIWYSVVIFPSKQASCSRAACLLVSVCPAWATQSLFAPMHFKVIVCTCTAALLHSNHLNRKGFDNLLYLAIHHCLSHQLSKRHSVLSVSLIFDPVVRIFYLHRVRDHHQYALHAQTFFCTKYDDFCMCAFGTYRR